MKMIQVHFTKADSDQYRLYLNEKIVWVDASWKLKKGDLVSFKDEMFQWTVFKVYETIIESAELDKRWGLDLPKSQRTER